MTCDTVREQLLELDVSAFDTLPHLQDCPGCQAFAERIVQAEQAVGEHVEGFAVAGDFAREWADAEAQASAGRRWRLWSAATVLAAAALALVVALPMALDDPPLEPMPPPAASEAPAVAAPEPDPEPVPAVAPDPDPEPAPPPPPVRRRPARPPPAETPEPEPEPTEPEEAEPIHAAPPPIASPPSVGTATLVLTLEPGFTSGVVRCPSGFSESFTVSGRRVRLRGVPMEACTVVLEPGAVRGTVRGGGRYGVSAAGVAPE